MKRIIFTLSMFALIVQAFSQSFTLTTKSMLIQGGAADASIGGTIYLTNTNISDSEFTWVKLEETMKSGWSYTFCDPIACYDNFNGIPNSGTFYGRPNKKALLKVDIEPKNLGGNGKIRLAISRVSNPTEADTVTFSVNAWSLGINRTANQSELSIYPNPAHNELNLKFDGKGTYQVEIMNLIGNKVKSYPAMDGNERIDISDLTDGIYILRLSDKGKVYTKRFTKS